MSEEQVNYAINMLKFAEQNTILPEGTKVKLDVDSIKSQPDYKRLVPEYRKWVDVHADKVMTVEYDEYHKDNPIIVCLAEDETDPKWEFWVGELIVVS
jgi:hypothetical protein